MIFFPNGWTGLAVPEKLPYDQSAEWGITKSRVGPHMCVGTSICCSRDGETLLHCSRKASEHGCSGLLESCLWP